MHIGNVVQIKKDGKVVQQYQPIANCLMLRMYSLNPRDIAMGEKRIHLLPYMDSSGQHMTIKRWNAPWGELFPGVVPIVIVFSQDISEREDAQRIFAAEFLCDDDRQVYRISFYGTGVKNCELLALPINTTTLPIIQSRLLVYQTYQDIVRIGSGDFADFAYCSRIKGLRFLTVPHGTIVISEHCEPTYANIVEKSATKVYVIADGAGIVNDRYMQNALAYNARYRLPQVHGQKNLHLKVIAHDFWNYRKFARLDHSLFAEQDVNSEFLEMLFNYQDQIMRRYQKHGTESPEEYHRRVSGLSIHGNVERESGDGIMAETTLANQVYHQMLKRNFDARLIDYVMRFPMFANALIETFRQELIAIALSGGMTGFNGILRPTFAVNDEPDRMLIVPPAGKRYADMNDQWAALGRYPYVHYNSLIPGLVKQNDIEGRSQTLSKALVAQYRIVGQLFGKGTVEFVSNLDKITCYYPDGTSQLFNDVDAVLCDKDIKVSHVNTTQVGSCKNLDGKCVAIQYYATDVYFGITQRYPIGCVVGVPERRIMND